MRSIPKAMRERAPQTIEKLKKNLFFFYRLTSWSTPFMRFLYKKISAIFYYSRYYKINPLSYSRHNTCEFRQHSGTVEFVKIGTWVRFLNNLIDYSKNNLVADASLEGLKEFNSDEIVTYYKNRTNKLR